MWDFATKDIKTDVTIVKIVGDFVYLGTGCFLHIYNLLSDNIVRKIKIFDTQSLFGIEFSPDKAFLLIFGANLCKKFRVNDFENLHFEEVESLNLSEWILVAKWFLNSQIALMTMQNRFILLDEQFNEITAISCPQKCIIYCAHLLGSNLEELLLFSGTVFNEIVVWSVRNQSKVLHKLQGHNGVVFSLDYNEQNNILCSTSDDRTAILWQFTKEKTFTKKICSLRGHSARVFRCKVFPNFVVTGGEDSLANVWSLSGNLLRKIEANQGDSVWAIDGNEEENYIITAGGDSAVTKHPIRVKLAETQILLPAKETPKKLALTRGNNIVTITESGMLLHYNFRENCWVYIDKLEEIALRKYVVLEASKCRRLFSVSTYEGTIYVYKTVDGNAEETLRLFAKIESPQKSRVYAFHWLSCDSFLACGDSGVLFLWTLSAEGVGTLRNISCLPRCSERWTTAACVINENYFAVGDRKGNLHLYKLGDVHPEDTLKKAHNYLGITELAVDRHYLYSLGRNSVVRKYQIDSTGKIRPASTDKTPYTWLTRIMPKQNLILAFSGANFVVWNAERRCCVLRHPCLGGHRSWDFNSLPNNSTKFAFLHEKAVNVLTFDLAETNPKSLMDGYHAYEVNTVKTIARFEGRSFLVSGGEDTMMRIIDVNSEGVNTLRTLKSHLSSIRAAAVRLISRTEEKDTYYVLTGGGRAQILLWELQIDPISKRIECFERCSYYKPTERSEMRVMDITLHEISSVFAFVACSDGLIKVFRLNADKCQLELVGNFDYKLRCVMKVRILDVLDKIVMLTAATDGYLSFWDVSALKRNEFTPQEKPFHKIRAHQSGVNALDCKKLDARRWLFLSGGDDSAVNLTVVNFEDLTITAKCNDLGNENKYHFAQVTGVFLADNNYFFSCSTDQILNLFEWSLDDEAKSVSSRFVQDYGTCVADIQGMECASNDRDGSFDIVLYGNGLEVLKVNKRKTLA